MNDLFSNIFFLMVIMTFIVGGIGLLVLLDWLCHRVLNWRPSVWFEKRVGGGR